MGWGSRRGVDLKFSMRIVPHLHTIQYILASVRPLCVIEQTCLGKERTIVLSLPNLRCG